MRVGVSMLHPLTGCRGMGDCRGATKLTLLAEWFSPFRRMAASTTETESPPNAFGGITFPAKHILWLLHPQKKRVRSDARRNDYILLVKPNSNPTDEWC